MQNNSVGWFEIPVEEMDRAITFYEKVLGITLERHKMGDLDMAWFPWNKESYGSAGSLVHHPKWYKSVGDGIIIYFTAASGDLDNELGRVEEARGKVLIPKKAIGEHGFVAWFLDTEGNKVALHSVN